MQFLFCRYEELHKECLARGFKVTNIWPKDFARDEFLWKDYTPTEEALAENRERIRIRMPKNPRFTTPKYTS